MCNRIIFILLLLVIFQINCITLKNRLNDFKDIFTIGLEKEIYGTSFFIWCLGGGLQNSSDGVGYGFRRGYLGKYFTGGIGKVPEFYKLKRSRWSVRPARIARINHTNLYGNSDLIDNSLAFRIFEENVSSRDKKKEFLVSNIFLFEAEIPEIIYSEKDPINDDLYYSRIYPNCNAPFTTEFSLGLYYGFRVGFNFSEAFDFVVGIFGFDPMKDDYNSKGELPKINEPESFEEYLRKKKSKQEE